MASGAATPGLFAYLIGWGGLKLDSVASCPFGVQDCFGVFVPACSVENGVSRHTASFTRWRDSICVLDPAGFPPARE